MCLYLCLSFWPRGSFPSKREEMWNCRISNPFLLEYHELLMCPFVCPCFDLLMSYDDMTLLPAKAKKKRKWTKCGRHYGLSVFTSFPVSAFYFLIHLSIIVNSHFICCSFLCSWFLLSRCYIRVRLCSFLLFVLLP